MNPLRRYARWLHTGFPAGLVEKLPLLDEGGRSSVPGVRVIGDLTGVPLLKFALDTGARAVADIEAEPDFAARAQQPDVLDIAVVGAGVAGLAAAVEAGRRGLRCKVFEASAPLSTLHGFPRGKPIYTYPSEMRPAGELQVSADCKEGLIEELRTQVEAAGVEPVQARIDGITREAGLPTLQHAGGQVRAHRVLLAIGRAGEQRRLGVPGEALPHVSHHLYDPAGHRGQAVLVVGGGDSAVEAAVALHDAGARVTLSYRGTSLTRPKSANLERLHLATTSEAPLRVALGSELTHIAADTASVRDTDGVGQHPADAVYVLIGRNPPVALLRRLGIALRGELTTRNWLAFAAFFTLCMGVYLWKSGGSLTQYFQREGLFPFGGVPDLGAAPGGALARTLAVTLGEPGFYYSLAYTTAIVGFGVARIRRRRTPYVTRQTLSLMAVQVVPLMLLPYLLLPWLGHAGAFDAGLPRQVADSLMPEVNYGHGREYWRAFGLILAWPLFIWNFFTDQPMWGWLVIGCLQTFLLIPAMVYRWGKGAYCGWICSCGALAETMGDRFRDRMPHGPVWNRLNLVGQGILAVAMLMFALRIVTWSAPDAQLLGVPLRALYQRMLKSDSSLLGMHLDYYHVVDLLLAGAVGVGCYFWLSGRVWCRFACPLAALMHIYARLFSRFAIFADKARCISCNQCTASCHQGIDVMAFASRGTPMDDPQCVRCSACVQSCPTGVLQFGRRGPGGEPVLDTLAASPVQLREGQRHLRVL